MLTTENKAIALLNRFYSFNDSVLRKIEAAFLAEEPQCNVTAVIATRDAERAAVESWVHVRLTLLNVVDLRIDEATTTGLSVLSNGLQVGRFDELYYFVFDPYTLEPENRDEYRKSSFYVSARDFRWSIESYAESLDEAEHYFPLSMLARRIYSILQERVKCSTSVMTYKELVAELGELPFPFENVKAHDARLSSALSEIAAACEFHSLPPLSAIVVSAKTGRPGKGYFTSAHGSDAHIAPNGWEEQVRRVRQTIYPPTI